MPILTKTCVIDVVGLTQSLIGPTQTPFLHEFQARSACREIEAAFPAVTCVAQATVRGAPRRTLEVSGANRLPVAVSHRGVPCGAFDNGQRVLRSRSEGGS